MTKVLALKMSAVNKIRVINKDDQVKTNTAIRVKSLRAVAQIDYALYVITSPLKAGVAIPCNQWVTRDCFVTEFTLSERQ